MKCSPLKGYGYVLLFHLKIVMAKCFETNFLFLDGNYFISFIFCLFVFLNENNFQSLIFIFLILGVICQQCCHSLKIDRKNNKRKVKNSEAQTRKPRGIPPPHEATDNRINTKEIQNHENVVKFPMMNSEELELPSDLTEEPQGILLDYLNDDADFDNRAGFQGSGDGNQEMTSQEDSPFLYPESDNQKQGHQTVGYERIRSQYGDSIHHVIPRKLPTDLGESNHMKPLTDHQLGRERGVRVMLGIQETHYTYIPITETVSGDL